MAHLPDDAFGRYVAMGAGRTYEGLAKLVGASKRSVVRRAIAENWQAKLAKVEEDAQRKTMERAVEDVVAVDERHLRLSRVIQSRALETLKNSPLGNGAAAVRALEAAIRIERSILGRDKPEAQAGPSLSELLEASQAVSAQRIEEVRQLGGGSPAAQPPAPTSASPAVEASAVPLPPPLAPRVFAEN